MTDNDKNVNISDENDITKAAEQVPEGDGQMPKAEGDVQAARAEVRNNAQSAAQASPYAQGQGYYRQNSEYSYIPPRPTYTNPYFSQNMQGAPQASYTFSNDASFGAEAPQKKKKEKKKNGALGVIAIILACVILAGGSGIGGALLANRFIIGDNQSQGTQNTSQGSNPSNDNKAPVNINKVESSVTEGTTMTDVISSVHDTVVEIVTENIQESQFYGKYVTSGAGSGVIISADGYIITNNHVIEGANSIFVRTTDGTEYKATMVGTDAEADIGVIKIEATELHAATLGNSDDLKLGEEVIAIGNPLGSLGGTVTNGIISALNREITIDGNKMMLLQTNAAVNPGNSGGGLFNMQGHLIGIVNAKSSSSSSSGTSIEGLGFAIPINHAQKISSDLMEYGYVKGKVSLGITVYTYERDYTYMQGFQTYVIKAGVYVENPGKNTELQKDDRFVSIDGVSVSTMQDIKSVLSEHEIGDTIEATVVRQQKEVKVTLTCYEQVPENAAQ